MHNWNDFTHLESKIIFGFTLFETSKWNLNTSTSRSRAEIENSRETRLSQVTEYTMTIKNNQSRINSPKCLLTNWHIINSRQSDIFHWTFWENVMLMFSWQIFKYQWWQKFSSFCFMIYWLSLKVSLNRWKLYWSGATCKVTVKRNFPKYCFQKGKKSPQKKVEKSHHIHIFFFQNLDALKLEKDFIYWTRQQ